MGCSYDVSSCPSCMVNRSSEAAKMLPKLHADGPRWDSLTSNS